MTKEKQAELEREFAAVVNRHSLENDSGTPDFIIAKHLVWCLLDFNATIKARAEWYSKPVARPPGGGGGM